ncbi:type VII toxin-antitoxin system MntA family adenylyltransferase antitoxin [Halonatronum saccharophilum]|uniref:type VII toxin-antitoxin system MntA family adenylyltransferase antitoxin n=1 Tax=Halonatronum saccharophilum TaxID=150060 RepID=UPI0004891F63|nr:nucleotidyltransferase domain-containing protein [Halonatronum saccharophilum]
MGLKESQLKSLKDIFKLYNNIKAAYLFGSYAQDKERKNSDIDIGILLDKGYDKMIKVDILAKLAEYGYCEVDLVILNQADIVTRYEIVKHNKIIYKREDFDANTYFSFSIRTFLDFEPILKVQRKYLKEQILNG